MSDERIDVLNNLSTLVDDLGTAATLGALIDPVCIQERVLTILNEMQRTAKENIEKRQARRREVTSCIIKAHPKSEKVLLAEVRPDFRMWLAGDVVQVTIEDQDKGGKR